MELFSRRRWRLVTVQLSNKFGYRPLYTVSIVFKVHKHNSLPLGQIRAFISHKPHSPNYSYPWICLCWKARYVKDKKICSTKLLTIKSQHFIRGNVETKSSSLGRSADLVVKGVGSCSEGCGFESQHRILDGHFSHNLL